MPTLIACFKWVIDETYIRHGSDGKLDFSSVDYKIGDYDRNAIEEAVRLRDNGERGKVIGITVGAPENTKGIKDALSRGPDEAIFVVDQAFSELEPSQTATILADVIRSRVPQFDLIICGEGSSDLYAQQVGPRLAENLSIPCVSFVQKITIDGGKIVAERRIEEGIEVVESSLPALVTVLPDINMPRIPSVKDLLMAGKKPILMVKGEELAEFPQAHLKTEAMIATQMERICEKFGADAVEINKFVDALMRKGVLR